MTGRLQSRLRYLRLALRASLVMLVSMLVLHTVFSKLKASATRRIDSLASRRRAAQMQEDMNIVAKPAFTLL
jgi:hypothetical protein